MLRRRIKKQKKSEIQKITGKHVVDCKECQVEFLVSGDVAAITCADCVQKMIAPPTMPKKKVSGEGKPRGWHFKVYFEYKGIVYSKGVQITDVKEISRLKKEASLTNVPVKKTPKKIMKRVIKTVRVTKKPKKRVKNASTSR